MDKKNKHLILPYRMGPYRTTPLPYGGTRAFMRFYALIHTFPALSYRGFLCVFWAFMGLARMALCNNATHIHRVLSDNRMNMRYLRGY